MGYAEKRLNRNEKILQVGRLSWARVILGIIWFPPIIAFIYRLFRRMTDEITLTNKRVVGKVGFIKTGSLDCKLEKIQSVIVTSGLGGKIFGYGNIKVITAGGEIKFGAIGGAEKLKQAIMNQIDVAQEEARKEQASEIARAMSGVINK